jgi:hypothetical protein
MLKCRVICQKKRLKKSVLRLRISFFYQYLSWKKAAVPALKTA